MAPVRGKEGLPAIPRAARDPGLSVELDTLRNAAGAGLARNVAQAGAAGFNLAATLQQRRQDTADSAFAAEAVTRYNTRAREVFREMQRTAKPGAPDFTQTYQMALESEREAIKREAFERHRPSEKGLAFYERRTQELNVNFGDHAAVFEDTERRREHAAGLGRSATELAIAVQRGTMPLEDAMRQFKAVLEDSKSVLLPDDERKLATSGTKEIATAFLTGLADRAPGRALDLVNKATPAQLAEWGMDAGDVARIGAAVKARVRALNAEARASIVEGYRETTERLALGLPIDVEAAKNQADRAAKLGDKRLAERWSVLATKGATLSEYSTLPLAEQARTLAEKRDAIEDPKAGRDALLEYQVMARIFQRTAQLYKDDEFAGALRTGGAAGFVRPEPVDLNSDDWAARITERRALAEAIEARENRPVVPLYAAEKRRIVAAIEAAQPSQKTAIMAQVDRALGPYATRFWAEVAGDKAGAGERMASVAMIARDEAGLARQILEGRTARVAQPHLAPKDTDAARLTYDSAIGPAFKALPQSARETMLGEVLDIYAAMSKAEGDTTGVFNSTRFEKAMEARFGVEVLPRWRGVRTLPPERGADIGEWMGTLSNLDLGEALPILPSTGRRVGADVIARNGRLFAAGHGRYVVEIDGEQLADPATGRPYMLDYFQWKRRKDIDDARRGSRR